MEHQLSDRPFRLSNTHFSATLDEPVQKKTLYKDENTKIWLSSDYEQIHKLAKFLPHVDWLAHYFPHLGGVPKNELRSLQDIAQEVGGKSVDVKQTNQYSLLRDFPNKQPHHFPKTSAQFTDTQLDLDALALNEFDNLTLEPDTIWQTYSFNGLKEKSYFAAARIHLNKKQEANGLCPEETIRATARRYIHITPH